MGGYGKRIAITVLILLTLLGTPVLPAIAAKTIWTAVASTTATATVTDDSDKRSISAGEKKRSINEARSGEDKTESKKSEGNKTAVREPEVKKPAVRKPEEAKPVERKPEDKKPATDRTSPAGAIRLPVDRDNAKPPVVVRPPSPDTPNVRPRPYPAEESRLRIYSRPGNASVYIDGVLKGSTPAGGSLLLTEQVGRHTVKLTLSGYLEWSQSVTLRSGNIFEVIANLTPQPGYGGLRISTYPAGTDIYIDGRLAGNSGPGARLDLTGIPEGEHRLTGRASGFRDASTSVRVNKDSTVNVSLELPRGYEDSTEGDLSIISSPGKVSVYVDNRFVGITSWGGYLLVSRLTPGYHYIRAYLYGYQTWESWALVSSGVASNIHIRLERQNLTEPRYYENSGMALHCNISGARVYLDGSYMGLTDYGGDLGLYDLSAGEHELRLTKTGYQDWVRMISLESGRTRDVDVYLAPRDQTGSLSVDCNIPNAEVYLDDEYLGTVTNGGASLFDRISAGRYKLVVRADGYEDYGRTIEIKTGERLQLEVKLERSSRTGSLEILSDPSGASVMIDGQSMGVAPRSIDDIAEGEHDVLLLAGGYMEWRAVVRVESGKTASVHAVLVRETPAAVETPAIAPPPISPISTPPVTPQDQSTDVVIVTGLSPSVYVNGRQVETDIAPVITAGRVMVPLRGVFQAFGVTVIWNPDTRTVICTSGDRTVTLRPGSREASINGKAHRIDAPPVLKNGRVLVPLRFISEALAADVRWDGNLKRVYIEPMRP